MPGKDLTRDRIITAATAEFAQHGIAGARVERIAKAARTSKERVYAHFRGKGDLYRYIAARELTAMSEAVPLDPSDLPGYAVRLHDHVTAHPERHRLMTWGQLELSQDGSRTDDPLHAVVAAKIERLREAQAAGDLDDSWDPADVLVFVSQLATAAADQAGAITDRDERDAFMAARRDAIERAVRRLFPPAGTSA